MDFFRYVGGLDLNEFQFFQVGSIYDLPGRVVTLIITTLTRHLQRR
jgi:hypothetical protein